MEPYRFGKLFNELWDKKIELGLAKAKKLNAKQTEDLIGKIIKDSLRSCPFRERLNLQDDVKDNIKAAQLRKEGNKKLHSNMKRYIEAIKLYNESITLSEQGSEERALAYGNRSVICLKMERYEECLENIRLARESNYPETWKEKLDERENSAKQALAKMADEKAPSSKDSSEGVNELQLSYPSHENAPQIANCLELHKNDQYGRHVVTNRKLNVGDIVMIDKPYVTVLEEMLRCVRCDFCHAERLFTLIPCEGCSWVMYCSEECKSQAYNKYHRYECGVQRNLRKIGHNLHLTDLRTLATAIVIFGNDPQALKDYLDSLDEGNVNSFAMDWRHAALKDIFTLHVLTTNETRDTFVLSSLMLMAILIHIVALEQTELGKLAESKPEIADMFFELILRCVRINKQQLSYRKYDRDEGKYEQETLAFGCFPLATVLNHSCAPNVAMITLRDSRCAVLVIKPIPEGGQLFTIYEGQHFTERERKKRQQLLLEKYNFQCTCEACVNDYPTMEYITRATEVAIRQLDVHFSNIFKQADRKAVLENITSLQSELNDAAKKYPDPVFCTKLGYFKELYAMLYNHTSQNVDYWKYCNP